MEDLETFERYYVAARVKESRVYTDAQVRQLPEMAPDHLYCHEWQIRKRSAERFLKALSAERKPMSLLEIGCGNGWLARQCALIPGVRVTGLDINTLELKQAQRVFQQQENLQFIAGDIRSGILQGRKFDRVVFAAAIQYFPSVREILGVVCDHLAENGEIHILDSFFYDKRELADARSRTRAYYHSLGVPEMTAYYFHHALEDLTPFPYQIVTRHSWLKRLITGPEKVFPWIKIKKSMGMPYRPGV
jgi:ubiquinone/menaquinone biosynthesis C-methylase UbiE